MQRPSARRKESWRITVRRDILNAYPEGDRIVDGL